MRSRRGCRRSSPASGCSCWTSCTCTTATTCGSPSGCCAPCSTAGERPCVTSNHAVDGLHRHPLSAHHADGLRALLHERLEGIAFDGGRDHREDPGAGTDRPRYRSGAFLCPGTSLSLDGLGLARPGPADRVVLQVGGRPLPVVSAGHGVVWLPFRSLCEGPTSAADCLELAGRYPTWVLTGVPPLSGCLPDVRARLLAAVDVAHDRDVRLVVVARQGLAETVGPDDLLPDWPRLVSRLRLLPR